MVRRRVERYFGEEWQGFRKGRGTADGMYVLRQVVDKTLEVQTSMALGFADMDKAFDTVPREMVMATLRWMGVSEAELRVVESIRKHNSKSGGGRMSIGGVCGQYWTEAGQRAEPAAVHSSMDSSAGRRW